MKANAGKLDTWQRTFFINHFQGYKIQNKFYTVLELSLFVSPTKIKTGGNNIEVDKDVELDFSI